MMSFISTMLTPSVKKVDGKNKSTETLKKSSSVLSSTEEPTSITPDVSPIDKSAGSSSSNSSPSENSSMGLYSNDAIFLHILDRITNVEQQNSKLRLENDLLEERVVALGNNTKQQDAKIASLEKELCDQITKFDVRLKDMDKMLHFSVTENAMLLGAVKNEILDYVNSTPQKTNSSTSASTSDSTFKSASDSMSKSASDSTSELASDSNSESPSSSSNGVSVEDFETLQGQFASLSHDNVALNTKIDNLHEENIYLKNQLDMISSNTSPQKTNVDAQLRGAINEINVKLYEVEKEVYKTNQYNRRQNLIIEGIPNKIPQRDLERTAVNIIHQLGFPVQFRDVVGCHRLHKPSNNPSLPTPTIIRFTNRKVTEFCIQNSRFLSKIRLPWRITVREDLCDSNEYILSQCELLKEKGVINHFMIRNGFVKTVRKRGEFARKVNHPDDLKSMFPDAFV